MLTQQALALVTPLDQHSPSSHGTVPGWRPRYAPRMTRGNAARAYLSYGAQRGRPASRPPVCLPGYVSRSCATSRVDRRLNLLTQEMVTQHHFTGGHARNGFDPLPDLLSDAGGELGRTQGTGEVEMDSDLAALNLDLIQQAEFAQRSADFRVAS